jgi:hypothetical protein
LLINEPKSVLESNSVGAAAGALAALFASQHCISPPPSFGCRMAVELSLEATE